MDKATARDLADVMQTFSRTKTVTATIKQSPTDGSGTFVAIVSTFGPPPDVDGDIVERHAFDDTITDAYVNHRGALWPVYWQHGYADPSNSLGTIVAAAATDQGLIVEGRLSIDTNEKAMEVYRGMLEDRIREWSIAYGVVEEHKGTWNGKRVNFLDVVELLEVSAVMAGSNRFTRTISVKVHPTPAHYPGNLPEYQSGYKPSFRSGFLTDSKSAEAWEWDRKLYEVEHAKYVRPGAPAVDVDAFVLAEKERATLAKLDEAKQGDWEQDMARRVDGMAYVTPADERAREVEARIRETDDRHERDARKAAEVAREDAADQAYRENARNDPRNYQP